MRLLSGFYLKDIVLWERENNANFASLLSPYDIDGLATMLCIGNGGISKGFAFKMMDDYLADDNSIYDIFLYIHKELFGRDYEDKSSENEKDSVKVSSYSNLTELYNSFCMQLLSLGISISEFWSLTTSQLYTVLNSIKIKEQNRINSELSQYHALAAMVGQAVWGKLDKKPPQISLGDDSDADDSAIYEMVANLRAHAMLHNEEVRRKKALNNNK